MSIIRVVPGGPWTVYDDDTDTRITLAPGMEFDSDDPIVGKFSWAFEADATTDRPSRKRVTAVETASAEPGTKRNR